MAPARLKSSAAACLAVLALGGALASCGSEEPGVDEPAREGLAIDVAGIDYNVFITRQLNLEITPDKAYYKGPPPEPGRALFGVFLRACNAGEETVTTTDEFLVKDNQGNEFEPIELPEDNEFAYHAQDLGAGDCIPEAGSVAQQGPTAGAMLLFEFPLESTENRPLELDIIPPPGTGEPKKVELDL